MMIRNIPNMFSQKTLLCLMEPNHAVRAQLGARAPSPLWKGLAEPSASGAHAQTEAARTSLSTRARCRLLTAPLPIALSAFIARPVSDPPLDPSPLLCLMQGKFDLLYLPIDFKNKCNVGYAFINFTSYYHLPAFYEEFNGRKWSRFNSNKVAQINYARIQGKDALIAHFANSSLIHEDESMQPLIFASDGSGAREAWRHHESRPRHRRPRG